MSIASALNNAMSGLKLVSHSTSVVSSNLANALDEGYAPRELEASARAAGGVSGPSSRVIRRVDRSLAAEIRLTDAALGDASARAKALTQIEEAIGAPSRGDSLSGRIARLEEALVTAASRPDSTARLSGVHEAAAALVDTFRATSQTLQNIRREADRGIAADVARLNETLASVAELNGRITAAEATGRDVNALLDQRRARLDGIADLLPFREIDRQKGQIALVTPGGDTLVDGGRAARFGFTAAPSITPGMTAASGPLSGLTIDGAPVGTGSAGAITGGSLAARFAVRDELAVEVQARLDGLARDLVTRFDDPATDPTRAPGQPGLFTDGGAMFSPAAETGLSARLEVNSAVDPGQGGALWRLRDGLGAVAPGDAGDARGLQALGEALDRAQVPASGGITSVARGFSELAADMLSRTGADRQAASRAEAEAGARADTLHESRLQQGVDSDAQMQKLMQLERAYAANARVLGTADKMIQTILEL